MDFVSIEYLECECRNQEIISNLNPEIDEKKTKTRGRINLAVSVAKTQNNNNINICV